MTDWREARRAVQEQARIVAAGLDHPAALMAAADAYALALAEWAVAEVAMWLIDDAALDGVRNKLAAQMEAEHD